MARQALGKKKVKKYKERFNLDIHSAYVRGNTKHRIDFWLNSGEIWFYYPTWIYPQPSDSRWKPIKETL